MQRPCWECSDFSNSIVCPLMAGGHADTNHAEPRICIFSFGKILKKSAITSKKNDNANHNIYYSMTFFYCFDGTSCCIYTHHSGDICMCGRTLKTIAE